MWQKIRKWLQHFVYWVIDPLVRNAVKIGITPNVVTTMGTLGNVLGAAVLVYAALAWPADDYEMVGWAGVVIGISALFDMADGYMARTAGLSSTFGAFYDSVLDRYSELISLCALAFYFVQTGLPWASIVVFCSLIGSIMVSYARARAEGLGIDCAVGTMQRPERILITISGLIFTGLLQNYVPFDTIWLTIVSQGVIAVFANITAIHRINHVKTKTS